MLIVAAAAMAALTGSVPVIDASARGYDRKVLVSALSASQHANEQRGKRRYCFDDRITDPASARRICRTLRDWRRLGLEPVTG